MSADFKSHVLLRDEKGMFGVPFKRLLLAGVGGGLAYTVFNLALPGWSILVAIVTASAILVFTGLRGGIPLWSRLMYRLRGMLLLTAARDPKGTAAGLADLLELPTDLVRLDAARVFAPPDGDVQIDLREWITFAHAREEDGLVFVDRPLGVQEGSLK